MHLPCSDRNSHRLKLHHIAPNSHVAESLLQSSVPDAQPRTYRLGDTYTLIVLHTSAVRA